MSLSRREFTRGVLGLAGLAAVGCGGAASVTDDTASDDTNSGTDGDTDSVVFDTDSADAWATGGTASMSGDYADPFTSNLGSTCALTCALTLGPCYAETLERQDVSEGVSGLPMRLALQIVDDGCEPVSGAVVDIWHCSPSGLYSGADAADMCTTGDSAARASKWFRGTQTTDASGRVDFDSCFPGWYSSRAVHIHFQVRKGGKEYVTSQLFFPQALIRDVFANHPEYKSYGQPDTPNAQDNIYSGTDAEVAWTRASDGALVAAKTVAIRSSLSDALCGSS